MTAVLSVQELTKNYSDKKKLSPPSVDRISFHLERGEILGLLGPNGSGKTTTIQMLLGTLTPTAGSIFYFGKNFLLHSSEILQKVTFASTYTSLPTELTIRENLEVLGYLYGLRPKESHQLFDPLLERFGILDKKNEAVRTLSAGQITRLILTKAFFVKPEIVLLDEPTASLDPDVAKDVCAFILEERDKRALSIIFCSHKMDEVMEICDRALFLKNGKIIADDLPMNLAKSVSSFRIRLVVEDGLKRTIKILEEEDLLFTVDHRLVEVVLQEEKISRFLNQLSRADVTYASIKIDEPSLEEFFLQIAKRRI